MTLVETYHALVADGVIEADPAQAAVVARLDELARSLRRWRRRRNGLVALLSRAEPPPKGLYIFGSVGRGKTMLMDLFFETTTYRYKRRMHFHEFMAEVHERIAEARKSHPGDPIPQVAAAIADKTAVLCFDEMHVTDIADAMIVGRLFKALFENQVVVVTTSNVQPARSLQERSQPAAVHAVHRAAPKPYGRGGTAGGQGLPAREACRQAALFHAGRHQGQSRDGSASGPS